MRLNETDIRMMVEECVKRILSEYHHSIDNSLEKLAELIIDKYENGGGEISADEINSINPYFKVSKPLTVVLVNDDDAGFVATYSKNNNEIEINTDERFHFGNRLKETLMHELSHFVDNNLRTKPYANVQSFAPDDPGDVPTKFVNDILYYFNPSEIQARLTQYKYFLERQPQMVKQSIKNHFSEKVLKLDYMETLISIVDGCVYGTKSEDIIQMLGNAASNSRVKKRGGDYDQTAFLNGMSFHEFYLQQQKISRILKKRLKSMTQKALKIKYDAMLDY